MYRNLKFLHMTDFFSTDTVLVSVTNIRYANIFIIINIIIIIIIIVIIIRVQGWLYVERCRDGVKGWIPSAITRSTPNNVVVMMMTMLMLMLMLMLAMTIPQ